MERHSADDDAAVSAISSITIMRLMNFLPPGSQEDNSLCQLFLV